MRDHCERSGSDPGRKIIDVGPDDAIASRYEPGRVLDARGGLVHPGLIEPHYHTTMHTTRGAIPDLPSAKRSQSARASFGVFGRWFNALRPEDEYASAELAFLEMAMNGVTCFMDPGTAFEPDAVAEAAQAVGLRGSVGDPFLWDVEGGLALASEIVRAPPSPKRALQLLGTEVRRNRDPGALVRGHVALYGSGSASEELERAAKACADDHDVTLTQHQNFDDADARFDRARFGRDPLVHLAEIGVLGENCSFMHMNVLSDAEIAAVASAAMSVILHPGNFLYYGIAAGGPSPLSELRSRGVPVVVASDIAKAWAFGDMGWLAYLVARAYGGSLSPCEVLEMQTRTAARAVGFDGEIGSLEPGKCADLVIRRNDLPEVQPGADPLREHLLVGRGKSVDTVIVEGKVVVEAGNSTRSMPGRPTSVPGARPRTSRIGRD